MRSGARPAHRRAAWRFSAISSLTTRLRCTAGLVDKLPFGAFMNKGLTMRTGQTHVNRWAEDLLSRIEDGQIDPSFVVTHTPSAWKRVRR